MQQKRKYVKPEVKRWGTITDLTQNGGGHHHQGGNPGGGPSMPRPGSIWPKP